MAFALSFGSDFFTGIDNEPQPSIRPMSVLQAIVSLSDETHARLAEEVFNVPADHLTPDMILERVIATNTCSNLDSPVCVWIDEQGEFTLEVFDQQGDFDPADAT